MGELAHNEFAAFFRALWDFDPFPWQERLLQRIVTEKDPRAIWPDVLDLPTGSGKTAALDIAVFHLALEAMLGGERRAPVRIAFVVDRRLIVDDAYERARFIARALSWSLLDEDDTGKVEADLQIREPPVVRAFHRVRAASVVGQVALRLRRLSGHDRLPLIARALRGGAPREDDWARTPVQPTILCSTVDQVGSRLLFRGYGVSDSMKPIHAGLLGSDCLLLLDEAHLSEPFRQTLEAVERLRAPDAAPFGFAVLTATPGRQGKRLFALSRADEAHPILSRRIGAKKPAHLIEVAGKHGIESASRRAEAIAEETRAVVGRLREKGVTNPAVGVVVNRVARARAVHARLRSDLNDAAKIILLIGPARAVDRDDLARDLEPIRTGRDELRRAVDRPLIVVATQTIEAGVDIDFDGLVTEAAALDALKQRFGRLNRAGRDVEAEAVILAYKDDIGAKADDLVYGDRIRVTWDKLQQIAAGAKGRVDFGIKALAESISGNEASSLAAPTQDAPVVMPAYAHLWSQTSPVPANVDPEVALFLHGPEHARASVQIVWRADIDEQNDLRSAMENNRERGRLVEIFKVVPPRAAEAVEVPLWAARGWLEQSAVDEADFSDTVERSSEMDDVRGAGRRAFRWVGEDRDKNHGSRVIWASELRNSDLIVVPAGYGGCDQWGWNPDSSAPVVDLAERAALPFRARRFSVRVTPELILQGWQIGEPGHGERIPADVAQKLSQELAANESGRRADDTLAAVLSLAMLPPKLRENLEKLRRAASTVAAIGEIGPHEARTGPLETWLPYRRDSEGRPRGIVFTAPRGVTAVDVANVAAIPATESDELSASAGRAVSLQDHSSHVRDWANDFVLRAGLPQDLSQDIVLGAHLHDAGKADARWQTYVTGGDLFGPDSQDLVAKSARRLPQGAWERAGLPRRWRHEALSVRLAMLNRDFAAAHDPELVLWLIGTHHGNGRPLFPHADQRDAEDRHIDLPDALGGQTPLAAGRGPQSLAFEFEGRDWVQLFERLKQRYGIWALARLEAFVRLADHRASEEGASPRATERCKEAAK